MKKSREHRVWCLNFKEPQFFSLSYTDFFSVFLCNFTRSLVFCLQFNILCYYVVSWWCWIFLILVKERETEWHRKPTFVRWFQRAKKKKTVKKGKIQNHSVCWNMPKCTADTDHTIYIYASNDTIDYYNLVCWLFVGTDRWSCVM